MNALLVVCLLLVPAPKSEPAKPHPLAGAWSFCWNDVIHQTTFLYADGTCYSPQFGAGKWSHSEAGGAIWFSERNNESHYVMVVDLLTGAGTGWSVDSDTGEVRGAVNVGMMRRGELLPMPRGVE